ncbi:MAG: hypothetical protein RDV00_06725 [Clostridia bacterium]|jgi:hypothetical protein|nr:DUF2292 domain-containing protein [Clostridia bacterium]MDQ7791795.1 hypothetical protein [Clostridia bacterium]
MDAKTALTGKEQKLLSFLRELGWGEVRVLVQNGEPVLIYESIKTVRLDEDTIPKTKQQKVGERRRPNGCESK